MVAAGVTVCEPDAGKVPEIPSMVTLVAFVALHARVEDWPALIVAGFAVNAVTVGVAGGVCASRTPPQAARKIVKTMVLKRLSVRWALGRNTLNSLRFLLLRNSEWSYARRVAARPN